jgi:predicted RNase H-like HicB family nuclease
MRYLVVVEKGPSSYGAYVPDLPGCVAAGESKGEVLSLIREAIALHLPPAFTSDRVEVEAA